MRDHFTGTIRFCLTALVLMAAPMGLLAQQTDVGLKMDVDKRQVEVGDHLTLTVEFRQMGSGNATVMGEPQISTPENFFIEGQSSSTQVTIINQQTAAISTTRLELKATQVGTETLGPALLIYQDDKGQKKEIKSNVVSVTVVPKTGFSLFGHKKSAESAANTPVNPTPSPAVNDDQLRGLKPLLPESSMFLIVLLAVIALLIGGFVWRQLSKKPKGEMPQMTLGKAAQLREAWKKLGKDDMDAKEFCLGLSNLVRECLQYRFLFPAVDYTTEEILKAVGQFKLTEDEKAAVEKCLKTCDRVLYADGNLTGRDNLRSLCSSLLPKIQK